MSDRTYLELRNALSLRSPQAESLKLLADITATLKPLKQPDLEAAYNAVKPLLPPTFTSFERSFPSYTFALATGVGKTRLMGAFIAYLYQRHGLKNFFVIAPNLTVYDKLQKDLGQPGSAKYVFKGVAAFAANPPRLITGDNYSEVHTGQLFGDGVTIHVFNIGKISAEMRGAKSPRIKRLSEYLGESYFQHLAGLPDLTVLMDESHHYRAERGMEVINDLKPVLGLEMTATPYLPGGHRDPFRNVAFEYNLAEAMRDGFVKEPCVATRSNFKPEHYADRPDELDRLKLEDGMRLHEQAKAELEIYSRDTGKRLVRPFMLVVAKDTEHASALFAMIESDSFMNGNYRGKVMEIHSGQSGAEKDENVTKLLGLEAPNNPYEIVIHVNMLKEGWDVTNLYTIVPLRKANAEILVEQTLGRGLRLPYGQRTGREAVETLSIIAHDSFDRVVAAANASDSIISRRIIDLDQPEYSKPVESVISETMAQTAVSLLQQEAANTKDVVVKENLERQIETRVLLNEAVESVSRTGTVAFAALTAPEVQARVVATARAMIAVRPQKGIFDAEIIKQMETDCAQVMADFKKRIIPIPRSTVQTVEPPQASFASFALEVGGIQFQPVEQHILRKSLETGEQHEVAGTGVAVWSGGAEDSLIGYLMDTPLVDYDRDKDLLYALVTRTLEHLRGYLADEEALDNVVQNYRSQIGQIIYQQMEKHFRMAPAKPSASKVLPFVRIEQHNYTKMQGDDILPLDFSVEPANMIRTKLFGSFNKSCHMVYKFDSKAEQQFALLIDRRAAEVLLWMRPAPSQFQIYWGHEWKKYEPDFVVETEEVIYLVEIKAANEMTDADVTAKAEAAVTYCRFATDYNESNGGKPWHYLLVPHDEIRSNTTLAHLVGNFSK